MIDDDSSDARSEARYAVGVDAVVEKMDSGEEAVSVTNLSASGCRLMLGRRLAIGAPVSIRTDHAEAITGEVKWQLDEAHGIQFDQPLASATLDNLLLVLSEQPAYVSDGKRGEGEA